MKKGLQAHQEAFMKAVGKNIARYRKESGLSQQDLGFRCDMDKPHISKIESGQRNFTIITALKLSTALNLPLHKLFELEPKNIG